MAETTAGTSLKDANTPWLVALLVANAAAFYLIQKSGALAVGDWATLAKGWAAAVPTGLSAAVVGLINAVISADMKARLVYWRWHNPLPGSEAFTKHGPKDPRVDLTKLAAMFGPLPTDPAEQNRLWYGIYSPVSELPPVAQAHRHSLFARDFTFLALVMLLVFGTAALIMVGRTLPVFIYLALLVAQWLIATIAARHNGRRLVTNALAKAASTT